MADIKVKHETDSGTAVIEIRGLETTDNRFRLYDISADKYLTRRGWTKTPSALPVDAVIGEDVISIPLDAELTGRISSRASLSLEQANNGFREIFIWPENGAPTGAAAPDEGTDEAIPVEAAIADLHASSTASEQSKPNKLDDIAPAPPVEAAVESKDPIDGRAKDDPQPTATMAALFPDSEPRQTWLPTAIAAVLFLMLGFGLAYLWTGSSRDAELRLSQTTQAAAEQRARDQAEFDRKLAAAQATSKDQAAAAGTANADLAAARDAALKSAKKKEDALRALQTKLDAATTEIASYKASGQKIDSRVEELTKEIQQVAADRDAALKAASDKDQEIRDAETRLADSEKGLRDVQSRLEVANVQIDALKAMAGKNSEAGLEKSALEDKITQLTADLDAARKTASGSQAKVTELEQKLAAGAAPVESADRQTASADVPAEEPPSQLQEERDLYARELKKLTDSFATLKTEKEELEKQVAALKAGSSAAAETSATAPAAGQAGAETLWGAAAVDMSGAIYAVGNQPSKKGAMRGAAVKCRSQSNFGCQALTSFQNKCLSVARFEDEGPAADNYGFSVHSNWRRAAAEALGRCERMGQKCTVRFTSCSPDSLSR